jgi:hypothetical protein
MKDRKLLSPRLAAISLAILLSTAFAAAQMPQSAATIALPTVNIDEPGRIPYQAVALGKCNGTVCSATFNAIPAGHRLVIQHVAGDMTTLDPVPDGTRVLVGVTNKVQFMSFPVSPFIPGVFLGAFDQPVQFYVDSGQTPMVEIHIGVSQLDTFDPTLIGYELDCSKVSCAPFAGTN